MTDPWGTPLPELKGREKASCTRTLKERCVRKERAHSMIQFNSSYWLQNAVIAEKPFDSHEKGD